MGDTLDPTSSPTSLLIALCGLSNLHTGYVQKPIHVRALCRKHEPCSEKHHVRINLASVVELDPRLGEPLDFTVVFELDFAIDDQLGRADVYSRP